MACRHRAEIAAQSVRRGIRQSSPGGEAGGDVGRLATYLAVRQMHAESGLRGVVA